MGMWVSFATCQLNPSIGFATNDWVSFQSTSHHLATFIYINLSQLNSFYELFKLINISDISYKKQNRY